MKPREKELKKMKREDLQKLDVRLEYMKDKIEDKPRGLPDREKEKVKKSIESIAGEISDFLNDPAIVGEVQERLDSKTRKQLVLMRKEIVELQSLLKHMIETF